MTSTLTTDVLIVGGGATGAGLVRDLARRGLRCVLVEKSDLGTGTTGRYHGLLHSGGRYVVKDPVAARECIDENVILRRIAPATIEDTGGWFVATPNDPDDYADGFAAACGAAGVPCEEAPVGDLLRREPALNPAIRRAFRVPDASLEPWQLIEGNVEDARSRGARVMPYHRVVSMRRSGGRILGVDVADVRSGSMVRVTPRIVVSAAGAWAGQVAAMAGAELAMKPGKGTMLIFNQRMTDTVVNRLHPPGDGDIMVPVHSVAILGTTEITVDDPDRYGIGRDEVAELMDEGELLFPELRRMRLLRAYAGVRPLYQDAPADDEQSADGRTISRAHVVIDHGRRDDIDNLVSIVGGKVTTYRLMAEQTADLVCRKLGVDARCTTADEPLPGQAGDRARYYWLGHRLAEHEAAGGGDADLICECEMLTRGDIDAFLDERWPCSLDDVRRGTRLGMGPCQGGFCTFRAAGMVAERVAGGGADGNARSAGENAGSAAAFADRAMIEFLGERFAGTRPIAWGRQLQELWVTAGIYQGVLGSRTLPGDGSGNVAAGIAMPAAPAEAADADR